MTPLKHLLPTRALPGLRAFLLAAPLLTPLLTPPPAAAQSAETLEQETPAQEPAAEIDAKIDAEADPEADPEAQESFGDAVARVFTDAFLAPTDWADPDKAAGEVCGPAASEERLDRAVIDRFGAAVKAAWEAPDPGPDPALRVVALEICLGPSGDALARPRLLRPVGPLEPDQSDALLKALAALDAAAPFAPPDEPPAAWRRVLVLFDPAAGAGSSPLGGAPSDPPSTPPGDPVRDADGPEATAPEEASADAPAPGAAEAAPSDGPN